MIDMMSWESSLQNPERFNTFNELEFWIIPFIRSSNFQVPLPVPFTKIFFKLWHDDISFLKLFSSMSMPLRARYSTWFVVGKSGWEVEMNLKLESPKYLTPLERACTRSVCGIIGGGWVPRGSIQLLGGNWPWTKSFVHNVLSCAIVQIFFGNVMNA